MKIFIEETFFSPQVNVKILASKSEAKIDSNFETNCFSAKKIFSIKLLLPQK